MKYTELFASALKKHKENPTDTGPLSDLSSGFWSMLLDSVGDLTREKGDLDAFLAQESDFLNLGLCPELFPDVEAVRSSVLDGSLGLCRIQVLTMTSWLADLVTKINRGDRKEQLEKQINLSHIQTHKLKSEICSLQQERKQRLTSLLRDSPSGLPPATVKQIDGLEQIDDLLQQSIRAKRAIARGVFFSVEQKREHVGRENQLQKEMQRTDALMSSVQDRTAMVELKKLQTGIGEHLTKIIEIEEAIARMSVEVEEIGRKQQEISPIEVESRVRREIEYLRDLVKLSAKRLHLEGCPVLRPEEKHFTSKILSECIDRILEFDPQLFRNDRVNIFGKPQIMLAPGSGNALYDWKNNRIVVPVIAPGGNFMAAFAAGVIEYRLDVDEDKRLLTSYNEIPELKPIRSVFQLRTRLIKDYICWMTSEYKGYRILTRDIKDWFDHEIAPNKNEIFTPAEYQQFSLSTTQYKEMLSGIEEKLQKGVGQCTINDLWVGSILLYQQGKFERSLDLLLELTNRDPDRLMVHYNTGQVGMKIMRKQEAIRAFTEYCTRNPQSWWARVARDHLRRLQAA